MTYVSQETLKAIMARDPDGGEVEPTPTAYAIFEAWAIEAYGRDAWEVYRAGGWAEDRSEGDWTHHGDASDFDDGGW